MSVITITKENFDKEVLQAQNKVLLDFWAPWVYIIAHITRSGIFVMSIYFICL